MCRAPAQSFQPHRAGSCKNIKHTGIFHSHIGKHIEYTFTYPPERRPGHPFPHRRQQGCPFRASSNDSHFSFRFNDDVLISHQFSKNILLEANEPFENFPNYTENLDEKINYIAFSYLSIACTMKEKQAHNEISNIAFEKSGDIIYQVHSPRNNKKENSNFYLLISSLSFYIASQYSKSFISISFKAISRILFISSFVKALNSYKNDLERIADVKVKNGFSVLAPIIIAS